MLGLAGREPGDWRPQVIRATALRGEGIEDVVAAIEKHRAWLEKTGGLRRRREARAAAEVEAIALGMLRARMTNLRDGTTLGTLATRVADGDLDPYAAANHLISGLESPPAR
jgi:LAO/AO transport system kinase